MAEPATTPGAAVEPSSPARSRFPCLDAYRAIAMTMIFLIHADFASLAHDKGILGDFFRRFDISVALFFVLSAFLLYRPYVAAQLSGRPRASTGRFYRRRVLRIFPAYWFALLAMVVLMGLRFGSFGDFAIFLFILQPYTGKVFDPQYQMISQAWSLATELAFYALLPLFALWVRRRTAAREPHEQLRFVLIACAAVAAVGVAFRIFLMVASPSWQVSGILSLPAWLDFFAIGLALGAISAWTEHTGREASVFSWLGRHPAWSWAMAGAAFFGVSQFRPGAQPLEPQGAEFVTRYLVYTLVVVLFVAPGMFGDQQAGRLRRVLRSKVAVWLGTISLGFYLFHVAIIDQVQEWFGYRPFEASFSRLLLFAFPLSVAAAAISYYVVERPFLRMKRASWASAWNGARRGRITPR